MKDRTRASRFTRCKKIRPRQSIAVSSLDLNKFTLCREAMNLGNLPSKIIVEKYLPSLFRAFLGKSYQPDTYLEQLYQREAFIKNFSFSIPCLEAIEAIKIYLGKKILDPMAGTGYWAKILSLAGLDVIATDIAYPSENEYTFINQYYPIRKLRATRAIRKYPDRNIFLSWPPYASEDGTHLLQAMHLDQIVALIGEGAGGCTGSDSMFNYLDRNFKTLADIGIPQFDGIHDYLSIHQKISH